MMGKLFLKLGFCLVTFSVLDMPHASAQKLNTKSIVQLAAPLIKNKIADGLSIGFIEGDQSGIVHLGSSSSDDKTANKSTLYELGSMSKLFTSLLLADAVVRGEIEINAPANIANEAKILLPGHNGRDIQWIDLSTHRSGLPRLPDNLKPKSLENPYEHYDSKKAAAALKDLNLTQVPGAKQEYSNFGASILGYLIAANSKTTYQELLQERIVTPLQMSDCTVTLTNAQKKRLATPHSEVGSPSPAWTFADLPGAGGVNASMQDMMKFAQAQLNPPEGSIGKAIELAWTQHSAADDSGPAMGLGWMIAGDGETRWHNGQTGGSHSVIFINRRIKTAVIVLCNTAVMKEVDQLAAQLIQVAGGLGPKIEEGESPPKLSPFTSVGFHREMIFVNYKDQTYLWLEIDGIKVDDIIASAKKQFGKQWQKRISEDVVEVLWGMDHKPGKTVKLQLQDFKTKRVVLVNTAPMTRANRDAIYRERKQAESGASTVEIKVENKDRARLVGRYQLAPNFIFDVKDRDGHMMVGITNQPTQEVFPESATRWTYRSVDATLEFILNTTGPATRLILHQNGIKQSANRIGQ